MAVFLPEDIVCNILARLPAKPLIRFRCVSKYWNRVLTEPSFMNSRSRKTITLPLLETLHLIDDNVPIEDTCNSVVNRSYPLKNLLPKNARASVIGSFKGIVLLRYLDIFILYNPFTRVSVKLPSPPPHCNIRGYGFGYGTNWDDLKIVRFSQHCKVCDVYNFKESSWSSCNTLKYNIFIKYECDVGTFINGVLYWIAYDRTYHTNMLTVLDVKDIRLSEMNLPFCSHLLGTLNGCLCALGRTRDSHTRFDMWVMKKQNQWSKIYSFKFPLNDTPRMPSYALCILDSGRILMVSPSMNLIIIYDPSKDLYNTLNISLKDGDFRRIHALEYSESLVSPLDMCSSRLDRRRIRK